MTATIFVDTNVFLDAIDQGNVKKQQQAQLWRAELWKSRRGRISFQVLQEFYVKVTQKWPAARESARAEVRDLLAWQPVTIDEGVVERGWKIQDRYHLSFWDAMIVAAARSASCQYLLTEDLQSDQDLDGIHVLNPFDLEPAAILRA
jgi:predicted nucleic acid-binding protein